MLTTFALAVLFVAMIVIFSQDIKKVFKSIFAYKIAQFILPLLLASTVIYVFNEWVLWVLYYYSYGLKIALHFVIQNMPFQYGAEIIARVLLLCIISVLPVVVLKFIFSKKSYIPFQYPYLTSTVLWIITAMILAVNTFGSI